MWIYFMNKKHEVFTNLKRFKLLVERAVERDNKRLRTDEGGEYISIKFAQLCEK